jgi:hypothetical protein
MNKYIILELIPTSLDPARGEIIQLSALKLNNLDLIDRFDYRIIDNKVPLTDLLEMISYDKENFVYKNTTKEILDDFKKWCDDLPLLIIDNSYTLNYLRELDNKKESVLKYLNMEYNDNVIEDIIKKYSEDYVALTDEMTEEDKTSAQAQNTDLVDNGLVINKSGVFNELLYNYYGVAVDTSVVDKVFSMNVGDVALIEVSNSFWVVKKCDPNEKEDYYTSKKDAIFNELTSPDVTAMFTEWNNDFPEVFNDKTVNKFDPRGLSSLFLSNTQQQDTTTPDTTTTTPDTTTPDSTNPDTTVPNSTTTD